MKRANLVMSKYAAAKLIMKHFLMDVCRNVHRERRSFKYFSGLAVVCVVQRSACRSSFG